MIIVFDLKKLRDNNGFNCYLKGRSYDLGENNVDIAPKLAVDYYRKGYYKYHDILCQYSIAISNYLNEFQDLFTEEEKKITFPDINEIISHAEYDTVEGLYFQFVLAAYYNYGFGVEKDEKKAFEIIYECAKRGHIGAIYDLGTVVKFKNDELNPNPIIHLETAANNGSIRAKKKLKKVG